MGGMRRKPAPEHAPSLTPGATGCFVYPFFLLHMLMFGGSGFMIAYGSEQGQVLFLYLHGGIAISVYLVFYLSMFGRDQVKWMLINAALGILGIYGQVGWILARFGKRIDDFPWYVHVIPFLYYVLYTFLLRQLLLDLTRSRNDPARRRWVESTYVVLSVALSAYLLWRQRS